MERQLVVKGLASKNQCDKQADSSAEGCCRLTGIRQAGLIQLQHCLNCAFSSPQFLLMHPIPSQRPRFISMCAASDFRQARVHLHYTDKARQSRDKNHYGTSHQASVS